MAEFDLAVVGGGAVGLAAAYHAARTGKRVVLFEQFAVGHGRGSSHGESRIIRHSYTSAAYASLAPSAFQAWRELELESGSALLSMTGSVDIGHRENPAMLACLNALSKAEIGSVFLEGEKARAAYPQFVLGDRDAILWQSGAGILNADRCLKVLSDAARAHGAEIRESARVRSLAPGSEVALDVESDGEASRTTASAVVVAAGPWAGRFFAELALPNQLRITHQQVVYYPIERPEFWAAGRCPVYIVHGRDGFYGFPESEHPGFIKVAVETDIAVEDPDEPPRDPDAEALERLNELIATRLRGIRPKPAAVVTCRYTETADRDFIIDRLPQHQNVVAASPCSGHGFKFSIITGRLASDIATSGAPGESFDDWRPQFALEKSPGEGDALQREWRD